MKIWEAVLISKRAHTMELLAGAYKLSLIMMGLFYMTSCEKKVVIDTSLDV